MRRLWRLWRDRRLIQGRYVTIEIRSRWWSPTARRAAKLSAHLGDFHAEEVHRMMARRLFFGETDEWPYPDEDPPDPL